MLRTFLLGKIHNCTLTATHIDYVGSISIDADLLSASGIAPYEEVQVVNITNGERLRTYAIAAPARSGAIELNGAAARSGIPGDRLIIMSYGLLTPAEIPHHAPRVAICDENNHLKETL